MRRIFPDPTDSLDDDALVAAYAVARPPATHLRLNFVSSADGAVTLAGRSGGLSNPGDRRVFLLLRDLCDVVLAGAGTVRAEGYGPARPGPDRQARREALGLAPVPPVAVVSGSLALDPDSPLFTQATVRTIVLTCAAAPADRRAALARVADVVDAGDIAVDPAAALATLAERGLVRVLSEGGPVLFGTLAAAGLVDDLCLTVSPVLAGPGADRIITGAGGEPPRRLDLVHALEDGGALLLRYAVGDVLPGGRGGGPDAA